MTEPVMIRYTYIPDSAQMGDKIKNKPRALIIDDEVDICYLLKGILRHKDIDADYVTSLKEADNALQRQETPLIFLDNHLSDGSGIDQIRRLKENYPGAKIIMITAHDNYADRERAYREGADYFIGKPFTREVILKTIEKITC